jgi:serine protease Do
LDGIHDMESEVVKACAATLLGRSVGVESRFFWRVDMTAATSALSYRLRPLLAAICLGAAGVLSGALSPVPAFARGPEGIADVAEKVIDAVVNISTSQTVEAKGGGGDGRGTIPQLPPGSPFEEFFDDFFKNRRGGKGGDLQPRKTNSLGSGFIIDTSGIVVTNNHVIARDQRDHE